MAKNLVIVESPAKAKTIEKFLGKDFQVESSFGHIADLPSKELGVNVEGDFKPKYIVSTDKKAVVKKLKDLAKKAETVWLASDEDREGEAIAWHLAEQLKLKEEKTKRIVFHEITKKAILKAVENPRDINYNLVNAQQARRVLDRLVGYELSPVLWRKVKGGLSAGRVQSVAVRLIVERERDIEGFTPVASYRVDAEFINENGKKFKAKLAKNFTEKKEAEDFLNSCLDAEFSVADLQKKPAKKSPAPPFTTSTLQQEASRKLGFPVAKTMMVAQRLYEAGLITYMRTDSVNLSDDAKNAAQAEIIASYGEEYSKPRNFSNKSKGAQEAHEAIRPTNMENHEITGEYDQTRLYSLIWKRTLASQMSEAQLERTVVKIDNTKNDKQFTANGEVITFEGFLKVYLEGTDNEEEEQAGMLPKMSVKEVLGNEYITATERYSRPPARFSEAALVKRLEELGIGRPSTYAPTISTIQRREYIEKGTVEGKERNYVQLRLANQAVKEELLTERVGSDKGKLVPTDIGNIVNDFLVANFDAILDYGFTAKVESDFDEIAEGKEDWTAMIKEFYQDFHVVVEDVAANAERAKGERLLGVDPESGKNVYVRLGRYGAMVQIGEATDEEKPRFASLQGDQTMNSITYEEAMDLFKLPKTLGEYDNLEVVVANGRFGPYIKFDGKYVSLDKGENPMSVDMDRAIELIEAKRKADAPIGEYEGMPIQKGVGRFGPFIKWNSIFINVNKKYDFDNLSQEDLETLIEDKKRKEREKLIHNFEEVGIRVEKARWGRFNVIKGKIKVELPKTTEIEKLTQDEAVKMIEAKTPKKKTTKRKTTKKK
ncbi:MULTISPECIES: type I DNA topoisomerase [unclassified Tenacibaculum]|uniref:type I DNA topoisomerase n=1 Tax=unclassified Tenacibaculum TaxID=2635139 RepID=UPI001F01E45B|nr:MULTISPECIES: type I DNA topoisomerase [unclassified Tenacibaculum]MCF2873545.1 type I DNA topoisomerase [Tenacibaculum sp. Cn5-1]MCF2933701.1 type I DNA topoisomerase [Tenacibaculum sp. Cn5-34]MCG7509717.1 type I DNA topoisomerase [Tenacibaculum sp. Cn5-46]